MRVIIYDDGKGRLAPLTDLRPVFSVRTGALTTLMRIEEMLPGESEISGLFVPEHLKPIVEDAYTFPINELPDGIDSLLLINGRCPLPPKEIATAPVGTILVERISDDDEEAAVVFARVKPDQAKRILTGELPTEGVDVHRPAPAHAGGPGTSAGSAITRSTTTWRTSRRSRGASFHTASSSAARTPQS